MAGKKGTIGNQDFLNKLMENSKGTVISVSKTLDKVGGGLPDKNLGDGIFTAVETDRGQYDENMEENKHESVDENRFLKIDGKKTIAYIDIFRMEEAPSTWNRYPLLKESQPEKYLELKLSIYENGVEDPLVLWHQRNESYMVLSGHNRWDICMEIIRECRNTGDFDEKKYRFVPSIVYEKSEIDEERAKEIIDDTNLYRDFSKLPEKIKMQIMNDRVEVYKKRRYAKGERIDQLVKDFGLKKSAIYEVISLNEKVIEPLRKLFFEGRLKKKTVLRFTFFDRETQQWIFNEFGNSINDVKVNALKKNMTREEITNVFESEGKGIKKLTVEVPENRVEEFKELFEKWIKEEI